MVDKQSQNSCLIIIQLLVLRRYVTYTAAKFYIAELFHINTLGTFIKYKVQYIQKCK